MVVCIRFYRTLIWRGNYKKQGVCSCRELAKIKGKTLLCRKFPQSYGTFVDNQETGDIYSSLITGTELGRNR